MAELSRKMAMEHFTGGTLTPDMTMRCSTCDETKSIVNGFYKYAIKTGWRRCKTCYKTNQRKTCRKIVRDIQTDAGVVQRVIMNPRSPWQLKAVALNRSGYEKWTGKACEALYEAFDKTCAITGETLDVSRAAFVVLDVSAPKTPENGVLVSKTMRRMIGPHNQFGWSDAQKQRVAAAHDTLKKK